MISKIAYVNRKAHRGCKYRTACARLGELEDEGGVTSHKVGNSLIWMLADDVCEDAGEG